MDEAAVINASLPDKDPLANSFIGFRAVMDNTGRLTVDMMKMKSSANPVNAVIEGLVDGGGDAGAAGDDDAGLTVKTEGARRTQGRIDRSCRGNKAAATRAGAGREGSPPAAVVRTALAHEAHPCYVAFDSKLCGY